MKQTLLLLAISLTLVTSGSSTGFSMENADPDIDRAYTVLKEAYQTRKDGNEEVAREKMARALSLFRQAAGAHSPGLIKPDTEYILEETPRNINLIENKTLFKIEFKVDSADRDRVSKDSDELIRQQQLILQKLIQLTRENAELKKAVLRIETETREIENISDTVTEIRDDTDEISELDSRLDDIKDTTDDIIDGVEKIEDGSDSANRIEDIADDVSDLRDDSDILKDILNIVEDIKSDTGDIKDLEDKIDEVKDVAEEGNE